MNFSILPGSINRAHDRRYWVVEELPRPVLGYFRAIPIVDGSVDPVLVARTRFVMPIRGSANDI